MLLIKEYELPVPGEVGQVLRADPAQAWRRVFGKAEDGVMFLCELVGGEALGSRFLSWVLSEESSECL
jgi:hypothetical protein